MCITNSKPMYFANYVCAQEVHTINCTLRVISIDIDNESAYIGLSAATSALYINIT